MEITEDVKKVFEDLNNSVSSNIAPSMTVSALICLAKNTKVILKGEKLTKQEKEEMLKGATIAAGTSALVSFLLG